MRMRMPWRRSQQHQDGEERATVLSSHSTRARQSRDPVSDLLSRWLPPKLANLFSIDIGLNQDVGLSKKIPRAIVGILRLCVVGAIPLATVIAVVGVVAAVVLAAAAVVAAVVLTAAAAALALFVGAAAMAAVTGIVAAVVYPAYLYATGGMQRALEGLGEKGATKSDATLLRRTRNRLSSGILSAVYDSYANAFANAVLLKVGVVLERGFEPHASEVSGPQVGSGQIYFDVEDAKDLLTKLHRVSRSPALNKMQKTDCRDKIPELQTKIVEGTCHKIDSLIEKRGEVLRTQSQPQSEDQPQAQTNRQLVQAASEPRRLERQFYADVAKETRELGRFVRKEKIHIAPEMIDKVRYAVELTKEREAERLSYRPDKWHEGVIDRRVHGLQKELIALEGRLSSDQAAEIADRELLHGASGRVGAHQENAGLNVGGQAPTQVAQEPVDMAGAAPLTEGSTDGRGLGMEAQPPVSTTDQHAVAGVLEGQTAEFGAMSRSSSRDALPGSANGDSSHGSGTRTPSRLVKGEGLLAPPSGNGDQSQQPTFSGTQTMWQRPASEVQPGSDPLNQLKTSRESSPERVEGHHQTRRTLTIPG